MRNPAETRERLLDTAIQLIWQSNYSNVGVNDICCRAGVTKGAFYHHFESKAELYCAASQHYWEGLKKELDELYSPASGSLELLENVIGFVTARQASLHATSKEGPGQPAVVGCPFFTSGGQAGTDEEKVRLAAAEMSAKGVRYYAALARRLKEDGYLNGDPDPQQLGRLMQQFVQGLLMYARVENSLAGVSLDLREGLYRLLDLKQAHRRAPEATSVPAATQPTATPAASTS